MVVSKVEGENTTAITPHLCQVYFGTYVLLVPAIVSGGGSSLVLLSSMRQNRTVYNMGAQK